MPGPPVFLGYPSPCYPRLCSRRGGRSAGNPQTSVRGGKAMPKYMIQASYNAEGLKGL
jgi:hypothetical protein